MPYNQSDYDTAIAAFRTLPETMAVENLISIRQRNEQEGLQLDKMKSDMKKDQDELDAFAAFNDEVTKKQIDYANPEASATAIAELKNKYIGKKKVQEAANELLQSSNAIQTGKRSRIESQNLDDEEANRSVRNDILNRQLKLTGAQVDQAQKNLDILNSDDKANLKSNFANVVGQIRDKHLDLGEEAIKWLEIYGDDEKMAPHVKSMGKMITSLVKADGLESINSNVLKKMEPSIINLKAKGIDLDPDLPKEELHKNYARAINIYPKGSQQQKDAEDLIRNHRSYYNSIEQRKILSDNILSIVRERSDISTDAGQREYSAKLAGLGYRIDSLTGSVEKNLSDRRNEEEQKQKINAAEKQRLEFSKLVGEVKNASDSVNVRKLVAYAQLNNINREAAMDMLNLSLGKDGKATPANMQKAKELLEAFNSAFDVNSGPDDVLDDR